MCGFVGFLLQPNRSQPVLDEWRALIAHRGPDQVGSVVEHNFGIGTCRLSIQDLSDAGNQPMQSDRYIIGFNGEIYNHLELRAELQINSVSEYRSHSDTETILKAIESWGIPATLDRLNGIFALAIWDRQKQELTLARDPLGVKPLYYLVTDQGMYFGSEIKALRPFTAGKVSQDGLALYLYFGFVPAPYSLLDQVRKVRAGEGLVFTGAETKRFHIVPQAWKRDPTLPRETAERVQHVRLAVEEAVRRQLLSDVPVGIFLSGGVDSSIIAAIASHASAGLASFTVRPVSTAADPQAEQDAEIATRTARQLGLSHHEVRFRPEDLTQDHEALLALMDEPVSEPYFMAEVFLSRAARAAGIPVILTGHGGDELFLGYPTYKAAARGDTYNRVPGLGPALRVVASAPRLQAATRENLLGTASVWRKTPLERYALVSAINFTIEEVGELAQLPVDKIRCMIEGIFTHVLEAVGGLPNASSVGSAELFARMDMLLKVPDHYNMRLDKASMSASVEARVPFQDLELIGLVMNLPIKDLWRGGLKGMLKNAFNDILPAEVMLRRKQTFQAPLLSWIQGPLAPWISELLAAMPFPIKGYLPGSPSGPVSTRRAYCTWSLALLEAWRRTLELEY